MQKGEREKEVGIKTCLHTYIHHQCKYSLLTITFALNFVIYFFFTILLLLLLYISRCINCLRANDYLLHVRTARYVYESLVKKKAYKYLCTFFLPFSLFSYYLMKFVVWQVIMSYLRSEIITRGIFMLYDLTCLCYIQFFFFFFCIKWSRSHFAICNANLRNAIYFVFIFFIEIMLKLIKL